jgi:hypothetical protein
MEKYTTPEMEIVMFDTEDVIRTSGAESSTPGIDFGSEEL